MAIFFRCDRCNEQFDPYAQQLGIEQLHTLLRNVGRIERFNISATVESLSYDSIHKTIEEKDVCPSCMESFAQWWSQTA